MKLNIAYPATGCQKLIEIEDDRKLRVFFDKKMAQEVPGDSLGDEWKVRAMLLLMLLFCVSNQFSPRIFFS